MKRNEKVKTFVRNNRTKIFVALCTLTGVIVGRKSFHGIENKELYKKRLKLLKALISTIKIKFLLERLWKL